MVRTTFAPSLLLSSCPRILSNISLPPSSMGSMSFGISDCISFAQILPHDAHIHDFYSNIYHEEESRRIPPPPLQMMKKEEEKKKTVLSYAFSFKSMRKKQDLYPIQEVAEVEEEVTDSVNMLPNPSEALTSAKAQASSDSSHVSNEDQIIGTVNDLNTSSFICQNL